MTCATVKYFLIFISSCISVRFTLFLKRYISGKKEGDNVKEIESIESTKDETISAQPMILRDKHQSILEESYFLKDVSSNKYFSNGQPYRSNTFS